jgi:hypothetical protein
LIRRPLSFLLIAVVLGACSRSGLDPDPTNGTPNARGTDVPLASVSGSNEELSILGNIYILEEGEPSPFEGQIIYLAEILTDSSGNPSMASMDRTASPRSITDKLGWFSFQIVESGTYGLVLDVIRQSVLLADPSSGEALIIDYQQGEQINLGDLIYDDLPTASSLRPTP